MEHDPHYPECHALKHAWAVKGIESVGDDTVQVTLICVRCMSHRIDYFNRSGDRIGKPKYRYVEGYRLRKADEKPSLADYRMRLVRAFERRMHA